MDWIVFGLGSNLGDRESVLKQVTVELTNFFQSQPLVSSLYETVSWGFESENKFLNSCIAFKYDKCFEPTEVLRFTQELEIRLGRILKTSRNGYESRIIDIDILVFGSIEMKSAYLTVPHPHIKERNFVLYPLAEILPDLKPPGAQITISELKSNSFDSCIPEKKS